MIPLELQLRSAKLRADADPEVQQAKPAEGTDLPLVGNIWDLLHPENPVICGMCGGEGVLYHDLPGSYGREPCSCVKYEH